jgi:hypothetical protein
MRPDVLAHTLVNLSSSREVALRSLVWLAEYQAARSVSLWRSNGDSTSLELGALLDEATLLGARRSLAEAGTDLALGATVLRENWALVPTAVPGCFAYVEDVDPGRLDAETTAAIATFALRMLHGVVRPFPDPGDRLKPKGALEREPLVTPAPFAVHRKPAEA